MIKYKQVTVPNPYAPVSRVIGLTEGGLGTDNIEDAKRVLNIVSKSDLGTEVPTMNAQGSIDSSTLDAASAIYPVISDPGTLYLNTAYDIEILNFDSLITYTVTANGGVVNYNNGIISLTLPIWYDKNTVTLSINGFNYVLKVHLVTVNKPTITNLSNGDLIDRTKELTFSEFVVNNGVGTEVHSSTDIQIATDSNFSNLVINEQGYTTTRTSYVLNGLSLGTTYYIRIRYNASTGIQSEWSDTISFLTKNVYVNKPTITNFTTGTTNILYVGYTYTSSAFSVANGTDTHASSDWEISTSPDFNGVVVSSYNDSTNLVSWTPTGLSRNTTYYIRVRHRGTAYGEGSWSDAYMYTTVNADTDPSGRLFYRHDSGMGTVMVWEDKQGVTHHTLVLDATYRTKLPWGNNTNYPNMTDYKNKGWYFADGTTANTGYSPADWESAATESAFLGAKKTDAIINAWTNYFEDANSSKQNTDLMMAAQPSTSYAAGWCRSKLVNGVGCDLPNIQTLVRIYCSMFQLDSLDPTADDNKYLFTKARTNDPYNWSFDGAYSAWSSTEGGTDSNSSPLARTVDSSALVNNGGKNYTRGVIPVLEITE